MLNGIAENVAGTTDALGECAAVAVSRPYTTVPLASRVQDAEASRNIPDETIRYRGCDPVVGQEFVKVATRCCRAMHVVDIYQINVRTRRSDNIAVRSGPVARGGDVSHSTSCSESRLSGSAGFGGSFGSGATTNKLISTYPEGVRRTVSTNVRISKTQAAIFRAASKSSSRHAAAVAIPTDCRLPTA